MVRAIMEPTLIFETVHGSQAYGLDRPGSDLDLKGVVVGPRSWYFGFRGGPEQVELNADHVRYEIRKLLRLLVNANPTVLELLFTSSCDHRVVTKGGERLLEARTTFLTKQVGDTFGGYARGQLKRIRTHRRWLLEPPKAAPERKAFGLPERSMVQRDQRGAAEALTKEGRTLEVSPNFLDALDREKRYAAARKHWQQFLQWKKHRNPKRAALEAKHGYDTKHAMHLVRLQRMAVEILERGEVVVRRPDRDELLAVRDGAWSYERLVEEADETAAKIAAAAATSALPEACDQDAAERLGVTIIEEVLQC